MIKDVDEAGFQSQVLDRSAEVPVVVDFWAEWCGPCRQLGPALEAEISKRGGTVELAKVDVDSNQQLSSAFQVQGIPAVKAFRNGKVVAEFTGALPPAKIAEFLDGLAPSRTDALAQAGDEASLREALELDPRHSVAAQKLGRMLIGRGDTDEARSLFARFEGDFLVAGLGARLELLADEETGQIRLGESFAAWDSNDHEAALDLLQDELAAAEDAGRKDLLRQVMVSIFTELGTSHPLTKAHRRRLALTLN